MALERTGFSTGLYIVTLELASCSNAFDTGCKFCLAQKVILHVLKENVILDIYTLSMLSPSCGSCCHFRICFLWQKIASKVVIVICDIPAYSASMLVLFPCFFSCFSRAFLVLFSCFFLCFSRAFLVLFSCFSRAFLVLFSCFSRAFLVLFLVLFSCFSRAFSRAFLVLFSCFSRAFLVLFLVLFSCFSRVLFSCFSRAFLVLFSCFSRAFLVLFSCFFSCFSRAFSRAFLVLCIQFTVSKPTLSIRAILVFAYRLPLDFSLAVLEISVALFHDLLVQNLVLFFVLFLEGALLIIYIKSTKYSTRKSTSKM